MVFMSGNKFDGSLVMDCYEKCNSCGHQKKSAINQGGGFSSAKCEKCGSNSMNTAIGATNPPAWWKP